MSWTKDHAMAITAAFESLNTAGIDWLVLRNHQGLPHINRSKDVDIGIEKLNFHRVEKLISDAVRFEGFDHMMIEDFHYIRCLTFFSIKGSMTKSLKIDLIDGFPFRGAHVFSFRQLYANAQLDGEFMIPNEIDDAVMLWCKPLVTGGIVKSSYLPEIKFAAKNEPCKFKVVLNSILTPFWADWSRSKILSDDIENMIDMKTDLRKSVWCRAFRNKPFFTLLNTIQHVIIELSRRMKRNDATFFAVVGPDGVGKTTFVNELLQNLADLQVKDKNNIIVQHFRPHIMPNINKLLTGQSEIISDFNNPHSAEPANSLSSLLRITYYWLDYHFGYWLKLRSQMIRGKTIIFDRYFYDFIVDPKRSRLSLPNWLPRLYLSMTPQPDLVFFLDTTAEKIFTRKQELHPIEIERQLAVYRKLVAKDPTRFVRLDANQTIEEIVRLASREVVSRLYRPI
jgi:thymidylate kinase